MLETIQRYIKELPNEDFLTYYQNYVLSVQDENIGQEINQVETFNDINKLVIKIQKELGNIT